MSTYKTIKIKIKCKLLLFLLEIHFWVSDERNATVCRLTLHESEMTAGNCSALEVFAEQYGVVSDKKDYVVCYYGRLLLQFSIII